MVTKTIDRLMDIANVSAISAADRHEINLRITEHAIFHRILAVVVLVLLAKLERS